MNPQELTRQARAWLGVPYRHQGRDRQGVDCGGFIVAIARPAGLLPHYVDRRDYGRTPTGRLEELLVENLHPVIPGRAREGDLIALRWRLGERPSHLAYVAGATIIQAYARSERVVEVSYREPWVRMTAGVWRFPAFGGGLP
jgi:cell wall-associated NlpC family hydrolase